MLGDLEANIFKQMLIIDGNSLATVLSDLATELRFFDIAKNAPSVCICRCSPT